MLASNTQVMGSFLIECMNCDNYEYIQYVRSLGPVRLRDLIYYAYKHLIYLIKKIYSKISNIITI